MNLLQYFAVTKGEADIRVVFNGTSCGLNDALWSPNLYFAVPKGKADIRVVFNGTSCGLNDALWSPNLYLPTARTVGILLTLSTWMSDVDFGDMLHNFLMDERLFKYSGVDVAPLVSFLQEGNCSPSQTSAFWVRWNRLFMGMKPSLYNLVSSISL